MINLTFEQISEHREQGGFIPLDKIFANATSEREVRGNLNRDKRWFEINDGSAMFKANAEEQINSHYSELICTELAKQVGLDAAQYDIATYNGQIGIITKNMCKPGEEMLSIYDLIGDDPTQDEFKDNTNIYFVFDELEAKLLFDGYDEETVDSCILQLRKQMLFDLYVMETDRHTQNLSFIAYTDAKTGKPCIRLAPMYDTESALTLQVYTDERDMRDISASPRHVKLTTDTQEPKISVIMEDEEEQEQAQDNSSQSLLDILRGQVYDTPTEEMWKATMDFLIEDERALQFAENVLSRMDIVKAIENVENEKRCSIPEALKNMAITCFNCRKKEIFTELGLDLREQNRVIEKRVDIIE